MHEGAIFQISRYAAFVGLATIAVLLSPAEAISQIAWRPVSVVTLDPDRADLARGSLLSVLQDFAASDDPQTATLDRALLMVQAYGRLKVNPSLDRKSADRLARANKLLSGSPAKKPFALRQDFTKMRDRLRSSAADSTGLLNELVRANTFEMVSAETVRSIYSADGLSPETVSQLSDLLSINPAEYFLNLDFVRFDLSIDKSFPLWDRMSLRLSATKELGLQNLYDVIPHSPVGAISVAVAPITLYGFSPTVFRHLTFKLMPQELRNQLRDELRIPVGIVVVRDLCLTCLKLESGPSLPLPISSWSEILLHSLPEIVGASSKMAIVGVVYESVKIDWNN